MAFPELENLLATQTGEQYWNLVTAFPCKGFVLDLNHIELSAIIRQSISKRISDKHVAYLAEELTALANQSYCAVKKTSPMMEEVNDQANVSPTIGNTNIG